MPKATPAQLQEKVQDVFDKIIVTPPVSATKEYFRLVKDAHNLFSVETIKVVDNVVVSTQKDEATFLPIAFDKLRRKTGEEFFKAVQGNLEKKK
jgi:hypothetical protein